MRSMVDQFQTACMCLRTEDVEHADMTSNPLHICGRLLVIMQAELARTSLNAPLCCLQRTDEVIWIPRSDSVAEAVCDMG
jgi:hypothetical protein